MENLTIGKLARQVDLGVETLRYYERRGLIEPQSRTDSGYRLYSEDARERLQFIRRAQVLGFSLDEVAELLSLSDRPEQSAAEVKRLTRAKIADIETRILDLERMKSALSALEEQCPGHAGTTAECPILSALNQQAPEPVNGDIA
ncbi:heavy metal-responsive transcriptional regulator [Sedimenticola hydrogenitrophicus]|uniref:heavy metal-responsive transcriptional regulator n=1 Tax=Sedimenticola hydrogenitrophicus TaxID=2967975 RepID=UPI0023AF3CCF|nr:heavy metal-responsive transcriptional regulator [Sedimenticola hydrogenitrophicus]